MKQKPKQKFGDMKVKLKLKFDYYGGNVARMIDRSTYFVVIKPGK